MRYEEYEKNLQTYYDILKQDFTILLTSTIPTQKNLLKTLLWLNVTFLGAIFALWKLSASKAIICLSALPFAFSIAAIAILLLALYKGRQKAFAAPSLKTVTSLAGSEYERIQGLLDIIHSLEIAHNHNATIVQERANKLHLATRLTMLSGLFLSIGIIFFANTLC